MISMTLMLHALEVILWVISVACHVWHTLHTLVLRQNGMGAR